MNADPHEEDVNLLRNRRKMSIVVYMCAGLLEVLEKRVKGVTIDRKCSYSDREKIYRTKISSGRFLERGQLEDIEYEENMKR